ncbi:hypothetical protein ALI22I_33940 [Saccharothrix sp. ALI-22-I]|uniref:DUF5403 family protein n=1 Tax=Saccharothrix sp. ALI-22-I TaxID=1933778 RepID=UPI00097C3945|nr:DUF5403 family protein [Saccharothrix sp. ALI-22-I]ONI83497.1 hypothetical protein ALI22I_33940 [Saccharothrix sp. ALI-22-I]
MAEVYRRVGRHKIEKLIALHRTVQDDLDRIALDRAENAEARLAEHRHDGDAQISIDVGDIDRYVVLDDERGLMAALSIEFGRAPVPPTEDNPDGRAGMEGLGVLRDAMGMQRKPRRGRR